MIVHALLEQGLQEEILVPWDVWGVGKYNGQKCLGCNGLTAFQLQDFSEPFSK